MSWIYTWISDALQYLGLITRTKTILFIGLDNAGKTTFINFWDEQRLRDFGLENVRFLDFDLGGMPYPGQRWHEQASIVHAIIFMVDVSDHERMEESKQCLGLVLRQEKVSTAPIVVLGNKMDRPGSLTEEELVMALNVEHLRTGKGSELPNGRPFEVFMCSLMSRKGHREALAWIAHVV